MNKTQRKLNMMETADIDLVTPSLLGHIFTMNFEANYTISLTLGRVYEGQNINHFSTRTRIYIYSAYYLVGVFYSFGNSRGIKIQQTLTISFPTSIHSSERQ